MIVSPCTIPFLGVLDDLLDIIIILMLFPFFFYLQDKLDNIRLCMHIHI